MALNPPGRRLRRIRDLQKSKSALGVAARARLRAERNAEAGQWQTCGLLLIHMTASPDGRHMAIRVVGQEEWHRIGSFRHCAALVRNLLIAAIERHSEKDKPKQPAEIQP